MSSPYVFPQMPGLTYEAAKDTDYKLSQVELNVLIHSHELWLASAGVQGSRLNLRFLTAEGLEFKGDLSYSTMYGVTLVDCVVAPGTNLSSAIIVDSNLINCSFVEVQLHNLAMHECKLMGVNMENCSYSETQQFRVDSSVIRNSTIIPEQDKGVKVTQYNEVEGGNIQKSAPHPLYIK